MVTAEQAIVGGPAAGAQEQGHGDAERLLEQRQHPGGLAETAGPHGTPQGLGQFGVADGIREMVLEILKRRGDDLERAVAGGRGRTRGGGGDLEGG